MKSVKEANGHINFVILGVYVDDIIPVSNSPTLLKVEKEALCRRFDIVDLGKINYLLGMSIKRDRNTQTLTIGPVTQLPSYTEKILKQFGMVN